MNWYGLNWSSITLNAFVLAIIPFLLAALGGHLAAKAVDDPRRSRNVKLCFWALFLFGVAATFWQQLRAEQDSQARNTSDAWMLIIATRQYLPLAPPSIAYEKTITHEQPDVSIRLLRLLQHAGFGFTLVNNSSVIVRQPGITVALWDLDGDNPTKTVSRPSADSDNVYVKAKSADGVFSLSSSLDIPTIKRGDRLFGFIYASCPLCSRTRRYWFYGVQGEDGWLAELEQGAYPKMGVIEDHIQDIRSNPEAYLGFIPKEKRIPSVAIP